ncbi:peptidase S8 and S53, subtilisin, kexin, sedolisin [Roseibium sp. TrichSKD4]|uniref:S8 family peptidase n=1 Tax=Roseibium sp. TrichSKD4 TaxID=744980 RepID=UPI0001E56328|nr:S8 family peptidase [Roseibium sp. TrichSKD4]EFO33880.1 peptidase S8 and S53, subtilisin, kexin, sedolisin [Roseibium sp. TrichSKD4]
MSKQNFLLGRGERLTNNIVVKGGGAPKEPPYTFNEARSRLSPMVTEASSRIDDLPQAACPGDEAVISLTLNPEYIAKSFFPYELMRDVGIEVIGSRPKKATPAKRSRGREPEEAVTTELFAKGRRSAIRSWSQQLPNWRANRGSANALISIEEVLAPVPHAKIKGSLPERGRMALETVLHANELERVMLEAFEEYLQVQEIEVELGRRFFAKGLCFLELDAPVERADDIALFTGVRTLRQMPGLRILRPTIRSAGIPTTDLVLPSEGPVSEDVRVAIFDGGIPDNHPLTQWATPYELPGMLPATEDDLSHGVGVTSAALFGHINTKEPLPRPYANIDHYRVLDEAPGQNPHELYEILERIEGVLSSQEYDFINLSLGPCLPIEDDDVHAWTAVLDDRLSRVSTLAMIAVGNDGEGDAILGLDRVQVPSDCVNALAIGACDTPGEDWQRALYSSKGPGRSPGLVKPDLVDFGGEFSRPFVVVAPDAIPSLTTTGGTSFATPSVLRLGAGIRAHFGGSLNHLAIRTLLVHTSEEGGQDHKEIGWGRVARSLDDVILCDDDTVRVVYQGEISPAKYIRAAIPVPSTQMSGMVSITATLCYKTQTDPHHPGNYTRAGLEVTFRPNDTKYSRDEQVHPNSDSFFGSSLPGATEDELRHDAWKWENCLHAVKRKRGSSLINPCFDIHYNARLEGRNYAPPEKLSYAMVVSVQAKGVADLYDQVVRQYATQIEPLRPILEVPIRT